MITRHSFRRISQYRPMAEAVTYYSRNADDTFAVYTIDRAWRLGVKTPEAGFNSQNPTPAFMTWEILASFLGVVPQQQDYLIDSTGLKWIVNMIGTNLRGQMYVLDCSRGMPLPQSPGAAYQPGAPPLT